VVSFPRRAQTPRDGAAAAGAKVLLHEHQQGGLEQCRRCFLQLVLTKQLLGAFEQASGLTRNNGRRCVMPTTHSAKRNSGRRTAAFHDVALKNMKLV